MKRRPREGPQPVQQNFKYRFKYFWPCVQTKAATHTDDQTDDAKQ